MVSLISYVIVGIFFLFSRIGDSNLSKITPRIINGTFACPGQFPFMVSIQHKKSHICGGTIISRKWILTAAHCIICPSIASCPINLSEIRVVYGSVELYKEGMGENLFVEVDQLIPHEDFEKSDGSPSKHDIGVIKLKTQLKLNDFVKQVRLNIRETVYPEGTEGRVMGWGYDGGNFLSSSCLQYAQIKTFSDDYCGSLYDDNKQISPSLQLCAGVPNGGRGSCIGDAGGPFVVNRHQAGINSWSQKPCASPGNPDVFTRVSAYINWIKNKTGLQFKEAPGAV